MCAAEQLLSKMRRLSQMPNVKLHTTHIEESDEEVEEAEEVKAGGVRLSDSSRRPIHPHAR